MAFLLADILLPANRQTQIKTALSNVGVANAAAATLTMHGGGRAPGSFDEPFGAIHSHGSNVVVEVREGELP